MKRALDIILGVIALGLLFPLILIVALAVCAEDGGPAIFRQRRVGRLGAQFSVLKFRSMTVGSGERPSAQAGDLRITRVGKFIRRMNIDELPQLVNVLFGEMSLVGPRPALASQTVLITLRERNGASRCRPGLTGLAQVEAYDGMPEDEKAKYDGIYASRISFRGDLTLIVRTLAYIIRRPPVY